MRMHSDDDVYAVHSVFLGPRGMSLPWRARYQAYGVGMALTVVMLIIEGRLGILGLWPIAYGMLLVVFITKKVMDHVSTEQTVRAVLKTAVHEVRAPRARRSARTVTTPSLRDVRRHTYLR